MNKETEPAALEKKRSRWRTVLIALIVVFVLLGLSAGGAAYYGYRSLQPLPAGELKKITIPSGTGSAGIARLLENEGIIRNHLAFSLYMRYKNQGSRFQAGQYEFAPGVTLDEIISKLNRGDVVKEEMIRFTIPEGYSVAQIADKLSEDGLVDKETFLKLADSTEVWPSPWVAAIPAEPLIKHRLEGYLFPETYEMKKGSTERDILVRMMEEWSRKLTSLPPEWEARMNEMKLSFHQMLTIASLIEREVVVDEERPIVAGVIYNRLKEKMPLQIDATVQYLFDKQKERLFEKDLQIESPYNTYLHSGLPPGPIASPSLASIQAALYPTETKYLFYVTKKDGTGTHLFAETFEEHKRNITASKSGQ